MLFKEFLFLALKAISAFLSNFGKEPGQKKNCKVWLKLVLTRSLRKMSFKEIVDDGNLCTLWITQDGRRVITIAHLESLAQVS